MKRSGIISKAMQRVRSRQKPLEIELTVQMNFGEAPGDTLTLIDQRRVPMIGSVLDNRDRIAREFLRLLVKAGLRAPGRVLGGGKGSK